MRPPATRRPDRPAVRSAPAGSPASPRVVPRHGHSHRAVFSACAHVGVALALGAAKLPIKTKVVARLGDTTHLGGE